VGFGLPKIIAWLPRGFLSAPKYLGASLSHVLYLSVAAHHNGAIVGTYGQLVDPCPPASQADPLCSARGRGLDQTDDWFHEKANYTPTVAQLDTGPVPMLLMLKRLHHHHHLLTEYSSTAMQHVGKIVQNISSERAKGYIDT